MFVKHGLKEAGGSVVNAKKSLAYDFFRFVKLPLFAGCGRLKRPESGGRPLSSLGGQPLTADPGQHGTIPLPPMLANR